MQMSWEVGYVSTHGRQRPYYWVASDLPGVAPAVHWPAYYLSSDVMVGNICSAFAIKNDFVRDGVHDW